MAGLLDFLNTPAGMGLLSSVAGYAAGARRGTPINNIGRGLTTGLMGYQNANDQIRLDKENAIAQQYKQMQNTQMQNTLDTQLAQKAWKAGLPGVMAPKLTGSTDQGRQLAEQNAAFGKEGIPALVESAQYARPDAPVNMDYGVDKQAMQDYMVQPDSPYADKLIERQFFPDKTNDGRTSEQKNWEFANSLSPEQRAQFMAGNKTSGEPSSIQEWRAYQAMPPDQQQAYREMKRAIPMQDMGGYVAPAIGGGRLGPAIPKTLSPGDLPATRGAQAEATATATAGVAQGAETAKKVKTADTLISQIDRAESVLNRGKASGSLLGAGVAAGKSMVGISDASTQDNQTLETISGWMVSNVPRMEGPQSNFDVQNYKTMAAVVGDKTKPIDDRKAALRELRGLQEKYKEVQSAAPAKKGGVLDRGEILNSELKDAISAGDKQNAGLIRTEMKRMGVKESGGSKAQATGTFKDPITVTNEADYNNVPKGKYYKAPDGSTRVRK